MDKIELYRRYTDDCLRLAKIVGNSEQRTLLHNMARTWKEMAEQRQAMHDRARQRGLDDPGDVA